MAQSDRRERLPYSKTLRAKRQHIFYTEPEKIFYHLIICLPAKGKSVYYLLVMIVTYIRKKGVFRIL